MSDHISGPRALAEPIADITDVYAFPSPERPGHLVLVHEHASVRAALGAVLRRARLPVPAAPARPPGAAERSPRRSPSARTSSSSTACSPTRRRRRRTRTGRHVHDAGGRHGLVPGERRAGRLRHGVRVFAGPRWDPFIMDAPAALKTIATGKLAFTDPSAIYLDGKNVLSLVVEIDCAQLLNDVAAGRGGRGDADAGQVHGADRAGRPAGGEEPDAGAEAVRSGEPRPRDPRPLQHGGRVPPRRGLPGRLPGAAQRQPRLLGRPRRQDRLAARTATAPTR